MPYRTRSVMTFAAALALLAGGCGDALKQPFPARSYFGIDAGKPDERPETSGRVAWPPTTSPADAILVRPVRVTPPYDGAAFVYRDGPTQFTTDYYVNWIASPSALLTGGLTEWLTATGPRTVITSASSLRPAVTLEGEVSRLFIDRTDPSHPHAVLAMRFLLTRQTDGNATILSDKSYTEALPVIANTPVGYAEAWGRSYRLILARLSDDMRAALDKVQ